jgi:UDP-N-acetyl-2-amino-2-deoxyglucuronate dehydrogenase
MPEVLQVAIVGCGRVAGHHVRAVEKHPHLRLSAICDLKPERMDALPGTENVPRFENYHRMFERHPEIDVVAIVTPSGMHFEHALDMVKMYRKSVVIEKPTVMRIAHGEELKRAAQDNGVHLFPVFQYRFNRCVQRILRAVRGGELGEIVVATVRQRWCRPQRYYDRDPWRGTYALDGGACTNQGIHHLDMLRYLVGSVKGVCARMKTFGVDIEVEDTAVATLEFQNGALGTLEITTAARPKDYESSISVVGSRGLAMLGGWATDKLVMFSPKAEDEEAYSDSFTDAYGFGHNDIYAGVYDTIVHNGRPAVEFDDGMQTIRLLHALYASDEQGGWVDVATVGESARLGRSNEPLSAIYRTRQP